MGHFDIRLLGYLAVNCIKATIYREPISLTISAINHAIVLQLFKFIAVKNEKFILTYRD